MLWSPNPEFDWAPCVILVEVFAQFGLELDTQPDERMDKATKEAVLKSKSIREPARPSSRNSDSPAQRVNA